MMIARNKEESQVSGILISWKVFDTPHVVNCCTVELDVASLDLIVNLIMIEKLVLGGTWTGDLRIFSPDVLTSKISKYAND